MQRKSVFVIGCFAMLVVGGPAILARADEFASGVTVDGGTTLTLEDCIQEALKGNPEVEILKAQ